ncbi:MAG TPA: hypothetical protein VMS16_06705, partial [Mycobacterium sp.]|nr:hypothetical protein [Mycobacterium sp.]
LAVLALPHRRILLAWMTIDAVVWVPRMYYLYTVPNRGLPEQWFTATVLLRDIAAVLLCALVVRQIYRPEEDLVHWSGRVDDPAGGVFDRAADAPPGWLTDRLRPPRLRHARREAVQPELAATAAISQPGGTSGSLVRLPTQATLLPRTDRGRT